MRQPVRQAAGNLHHRKRDDKRRNAEYGDHGAGECTDQSRGQNARGAAGNERKRSGVRAAAIIADQQAGDDGGQRDEASDGQVDAAGDDHHRHADRDDRIHNDLIGDVQEIVGVQKSWPPIAAGSDELRVAHRGNPLRDVGKPFG